MSSRGKLWGGRFEKPTDKKVEAFTASIDYDRRLYRQDIRGSIAHCRALAQAGLLAPAEAQALLAALEEVRAEIEGGQLPFAPSLEDIHTHIEARLRDKVGELADKLRTARSRNDQIALDMRLFVREAIASAVERLTQVQQALLGLASRYPDAPMPGYTHLQRAQPVLVAHHLLAYFEMFQRDIERFRDAYCRCDVLPLGSGALAGVPYPIDRQALALELGFAQISRNSLDAVSDRDFVVEFLFAAAVTMMHLSRLAEEIVLWSTAEFGFVELDDAYATGSSLMPQKKNPDVAELVRAKAGRVYGHLVAMLTILKGLPLAYNRDLQEDKEGLFDATDTLLGCLEVTAGMLGTMRPNRERMRRAAAEGFALATDLADYLVQRGLPFRQAHEVVGRLVRWCVEEGKALHQLTLEEYRAFSPLFEADALALSVETSIAARQVPGGTSPRLVSQALAQAAALVQESQKWLESLAPPHRP